MTSQIPLESVVCVIATRAGVPVPSIEELQHICVSVRKALGIESVSFVDLQRIAALPPPDRSFRRDRIKAVMCLIAPSSTEGQVILTEAAKEMMRLVLIFNRKNLAEDRQFELCDLYALVVQELAANRAAA